MDYSIHYSRFHDDTEEHAELMAAGIGASIEPYIHVDRELPALDLGCGYGFALRALRNLGFRNVVGLECSPQQAERSRKAGFEVQVSDDSPAWLKTKPAHFGLVLLQDVLEHVPIAEQIDFVRSIYGALRPGGKLYLTVPNANAILAARWRYIDYTHHCSFTEHSLHFVLASAGFGNIAFASEKGIGRFPVKLWKRSSRNAARKWIARWCWLQVFKGELPSESIDPISFELNLRAVATK